MENNNLISQELFETIERYLKNSMDKKEHATFTKTLEKDSTLQQRIKEVETILLGIRRGSFKHKATQFHEEVILDKTATLKEKKVFKLNYKYISVAASVAILFGSFWFFNRPSKNEAIFNTYFIEDRGLETKMGETTKYTFDDAMVDYKRGKYFKAIEKWNLQLDNKPNNDTLNYFLGVAHLANKNELKAISYLETTVKNNKSAFLNEAYFYLGLSYLKMDKTDLAINAFEKNNSEKSKAIIKQLKS